MRTVCLWSLLAASSLLHVSCGGAAPAPASADPSEDAYTAETEQADLDEEVHADAADSASTDNAAEGSGATSGATPTQPAPADPNGETRTNQVISDFVSKNRQLVRDCVNEEQRKNPSLGGDLVLSFVLEPAGKVTKLTVNEEKTTFNSKPATDCVLKVVQGWTFPASSRGMETVVNYPFTFNARK